MSKILVVCHSSYVNAQGPQCVSRSEVVIKRVPGLGAAADKHQSGAQRETAGCHDSRSVPIADRV
jgi:hypothetical protein